MIDPLDFDPMDARTARNIKIVVSIAIASLWAFFLYIQVVFSTRFFPSAEVPNPGGVSIAVGVLVIAVSVVVAAATVWFTRRLPAGFIAVIHILVMIALFALTWI
ncbi:hypothetical protein BW730_04825 [Tessaracoccus aquimaris]|uniref:Uncharacterized protein n=1 Tax=Tessaracoccus aquimaris TaxID=1332264 RepID=A0A1Q2CLJ4_9ACTN|nr:hypothetical protein [Tessaracoccus aquimaris]AQP46945.1 hypothetical protein BW730_04825 [Tessaracoccus aquimaris]